MFVRWKKYKLRDGSHSLTAVLVESQRVNGKPRLKVIWTLATIKERKINRINAVTEPERMRFWKWVKTRLGILGVAGPVGAKLISAIAQRVPEWTAEDDEKHKAVCDEDLRRYRARCEEKRFQKARVVS